MKIEETKVYLPERKGFPIDLISFRILEISLELQVMCKDCGIDFNF